MLALRGRVVPAVRRSVVQSRRFLGTQDSGARRTAAPALSPLVRACDVCVGLRGLDGGDYRRKDREVRDPGTLAAAYLGVGRRWMSSADSSKHAVSETETSINETELSKFEQFKLRAPVWGGAIAGAVVVYGLSKIMMYVTSTFMHINFTTVGVIGFATGFSTASMAAGGAYAAFRFLTIRPERVYRHALARIASDPLALDRLGSPIKSGSLKAYTLRPGGFGLDENRNVAWLPPRVQMMFSLEGDRTQAMATVECSKIMGKLDFSIISVDVINPRSSKTELFIVEGTKDRLKVRGQLRGFLQTERVSYLEQVVPDSVTEREFEMEDLEVQK